MFELKSTLRLFILGVILIFGVLSSGSVQAVPVADDVTSHSFHAAGDHDEVPADEHGSTPHHHTGCAGHDVPARANAEMGQATFVFINQPLLGWEATALDDLSQDPGLRPPIA